MRRLLTLLVFYLAVRGLQAVDKSVDNSQFKVLLNYTENVSEPHINTSSAPEVKESKQGDVHHFPARDGRVLQPTSEPLEEELDNQENIISQLLGDYDKVKTVSSGSDCVCRCVVRPIKRSDCSRFHDSEKASPAQDFYTVETITKGTDCKQCVCMAPPSAVNPCEGEYRFKKLQEASKSDIKLATIVDLLEGSLFGLDLIKLNSVTTKLLTRVDNMEKAFAQNFTERIREKERVKERAKEKEKDKKAQQKKKKTSDLEHSGSKSGGAAYANKQKTYEAQLKKNQQQDGLEQQSPAGNETETKQTGKDKSGVVIRGVTFYKAEEEGHKEDEEQKRGRGKNAEDLLNSDKAFVRTFFNVPMTPDVSSPAQPKASSKSTKAKSTPSSTKPAHEFTATRQTITMMATTVQQTTRETIQPTSPASLRTTSPSNISPSFDAFPTAPSQQRPRSRLSWTESPADQLKITKRPGKVTAMSQNITSTYRSTTYLDHVMFWAVCKDTVASISEPVQQNSYGLSDGAWMRDARGHGNVIYLTNGHYGNSLLEFRDMDTFKSGQASNSYKLPYSFTGTGHVVYNGAFYYNRAFSRDVIRYDLRHRYVSAWTTLHDALLEEQVHRTQTEVEFAVDESGLWLLYPALDTEGFHQEVILLIHLHPRDLQPVRTFRTGLRRGRYGNTFLVCGVLYAVDSIERRYANVTYAFDTHTLTHTVPSLAFTNMHTHTSQVAYCPLDKKLYAWDGGNQMMYDVIFAY